MTVPSHPAVLPSDAGPGQGRRHGLDALRALALGLGIVLHSLLAFVPDAGWLVADDRPGPAAGVAVYAIHLFRMTTFMLLAGYFGRMVLHRRGTGSYLRDRLLRIGLPLVVFWPVSVVSLAVLVAVGSVAFGLPMPVSPPPPPGTPAVLTAFSPGQLWFLLVLLECAFLTVAARAAGYAVLGAERVRRVTGRLADALSAPAGVLLAAVPYLVALLVQGGAGGGIVEPRTVLPEAAALIGYGGAFVVGWILHSRTDALARIARVWPAMAVLALLAGVAGWFAEPLGAPLPVAAAVVALAGTAATYALLGLFSGPLDWPGRVRRYLADSAYWVYLLHLPVLVAVQMPLAGASWPVALKLLVAWAVTAAVCLLTYDVLVRSTWVGRWLNGHRRRSVLLRRG